MLMTSLAFLAAMTSTEPNVTSATGDWSNIPLVSKRNNLDGTYYVLDQLERVARTSECNVPGLSRKRIKLAVPFLIQFDSSGRVSEVVVRRLNCPAAEAALAGAIRKMAVRGEYRPSGTNLTGWYRGAFNVDSAVY